MLSVLLSTCLAYDLCARALDLRRKTIEKQAEEFVRALSLFRTSGNVEIELTIEGGSEMVTEFEKNYPQLVLSRPECVHFCLLLRRYSQNKNGSAKKTDCVSAVYHDHDFARRKQLFHDYLEPLKERVSKEEYDEAWSEVLELTRNPALLIYGAEPEILKEYADSIRGIGLGLEECWDEYVFKEDVLRQDEEETNRFLTFRDGKARLADKYGSYSPALKAQFGKKLNMSEVLAEFNKVVQSTEPLKLIFRVSVEASLESVSRMNLSRRGTTDIVLRYYTESFGTSYYASSLTSGPSFSFSCCGNDLEELIAYLRLLGYEK